MHAIVPTTSSGFRIEHSTGNGVAVRYGVTVTRADTVRHGFTVDCVGLVLVDQCTNVHRERTKLWGFIYGYILEHGRSNGRRDELIDECAPSRHNDHHNIYRYTGRRRNGNDHGKRPKRSLHNDSS